MVRQAPFLTGWREERLTLGGQRRPKGCLVHPLRVTHGLVTVPADAHQVPPLLSLSIRVPDIQGQRRRPAQMVDVMHQIRPAVTAAVLADQALVVVHPFHLAGNMPPFRRHIERMHITRLDQAAEPA